MSRNSHKNASGSRKRRQSVPLWRALFQREDKQDLVRSRDVLEAPSGPTDPGVAALTLGSSREISTHVVNAVDATQRLQAEDRLVPNIAPSNDQTTSKAKVSFWRRVLRRTNSSSPQDVSEGAEASDDAPVTTAPPSKVPFWRKFTR
jgi:hypothetical protein